MVDTFNQFVVDHKKQQEQEKSVCKYYACIGDGDYVDDEGNYIMIACDQAIFLPMMHMSVQSKENLIYFPRVCYHYDIDLNKPNLFSDTNERSYAQKMSAEWIRERGFVN